MSESFIYENGQRKISNSNFARNPSIIYPIAFNHLSLMAYNPDKTLEEIIVFEKLLVLYRSFKLKPFTYQQERLMSELRFGRTKLDKATATLARDGILNVVNPGPGKKIKYSFNQKKLIDALPLLYKMPKDDALRQSLLRELKDFYSYYLTARYLHVVNDPSIPDEIYEGKVNLVTTGRQDINNIADRDGDNSPYKIDEQ